MAARLIELAWIEVGIGLNWMSSIFNRIQLNFQQANS